MAAKAHTYLLMPSCARLQVRGSVHNAQAAAPSRRPLCAVRFLLPVCACVSRVCRVRTRTRLRHRPRTLYGPWPATWSTHPVRACYSPCTGLLLTLYGLSHKARTGSIGHVVGQGAHCTIYIAHTYRRTVLLTSHIRTDAYTLHTRTNACSLLVTHTHAHVPAHMRMHVLTRLPRACAYRAPPPYMPPHTPYTYRHIQTPCVY